MIAVNKLILILYIIKNLKFVSLNISSNMMQSYKRRHGKKKEPEVVLAASTKNDNRKMKNEDSAKSSYVVFR